MLRLPSLLRACLLIMSLCQALPSYASDSPHIRPFETAVKQYLTPIPQIEPKCGMKGVDCMYVINLAGRPEKWQRVKQICSEYGLTPSRVNAVDGGTLSKKALKSICGGYPIRHRRGVYGCFLSHFSVFADSHRRQLNRVWICEDDIDFLENPLQMAELLDKLTEIDPDWDVLYTDIDTMIPECYRWKESGKMLPNRTSDFRPDQSHLPMSYYLSRQKVDENFTRIGQRYGLYSYFVSKKGIEKLMQYFLHVYIYTAIDRDIHYVPNIRQYVLNKNLISHWVKSGTNDTQKP